MARPLIEDTLSAFIKKMDEDKKPKMVYTDAHYPPTQTFYCRYCKFPTLHYYHGLFKFRGYKNISTRIRHVGYECELCKNPKMFKYCPPERKLKFEIVRGL